MKTLSKILATSFLGLSLASCSTITENIKPKSEIEIAYVPSRCDDKIMKNELMIDIGIGISYNFTENISFDVGGNSRTYMFPFFKGVYSDPTRQEYDIYSNINFNNLIENVNLSIYAFHNCSHPVKDVEFWLKDNRTGNRYAINHDSISKFGFKLTINE